MEAAIEHALQHIPEKYGRNGYAFKRMPKLYMERNASKLEDFWRKLESMGHDDVAKLL